ncbi:hypothetical protein KUV51_12370 [Tateyamaria omphalii]|uniref:hypothetical protein n=1 Tax=Tateyamaria omphalii TaxID=299262 RepID=UPI001C99A7EF|nr:hypothetical protein [Tateyamaria omphalii]MBY5933797.1 hypothetical protein [Tateyamaria omphalii]
MTRTGLMLAAAAFALAACDETTQSGGAGGPFISPLPDNILAMADPKQDLNAVKVDPVDGCLVYRHVGPVETTFLPLRNREGRPICTRPAAETTPAT